MPSMPHVLCSLCPPIFPIISYIPQQQTSHTPYVPHINPCHYTLPTCPLCHYSPYTLYIPLESLMLPHCLICPLYPHIPTPSFASILPYLLCPYIFYVPLSPFPPCNQIQCQQVLPKFFFTYKLDEIGNNTSIGIRGCTTWKQKFPVTKCYLQWVLNPWTSDSKSNTLLSEPTWHLLVRHSIWVPYIVMRYWFPLNYPSPKIKWCMNISLKIS